MKKTTCLIVILASIIFHACNMPNNGASHAISDMAKEEKSINNMLDSFNRAAAKADFNGYFNFYTDDAVFTGTDATERWDKKSFMIWAKPYFDRGKAWNFTTIQRYIHFDKTGALAWFDELLNTQMKICRGSGVVVKLGNDWKVQQYILSMTIPNKLADSIVKIKGPLEDSILLNRVQNK